jgi:hypothetical protein
MRRGEEGRKTSREGDRDHRILAGESLSLLLDVLLEELLGALDERMRQDVGLVTLELMMLQDISSLLCLPRRWKRRREGDEEEGGGEFVQTALRS